MFQADPPNNHQITTWSVVSWYVATWFPSDHYVPGIFTHWITTWSPSGNHVPSFYIRYPPNNHVVYTFPVRSKHILLISTKHQRSVIVFYSWSIPGGFYVVKTTWVLGGWANWFPLSETTFSPSVKVYELTTWSPCGSVYVVATWSVPRGYHVVMTTLLPRGIDT